MGLELGFFVDDDDDFFKIFMVSFCNHFDCIKKKYLSALHKTSKSLTTVSCCSSLQPFNILDY